MKKLLSLILVLAMCLCAFAACKPADGDNKETDPAGDQEQALAGEYAIKVWVAENAVDLTEKQIKAYNDSNEDGIVIKATIEPVGEGEAATSMTTDVEAGADLYCFAQDQAARLIQSGALAKLGVAAAEKVSKENAAGVVSAVVPLVQTFVLTVLSAT